MALIAVSSMAAPPPGTIDPTFSVGRGPLQVSSGTGYGAVLQSDGGIVVGGFFNGLGFTSVDGLVRLNADGSFDPTFDSSALAVDVITTGYYLKALCLQADGRIIVGGNFFTGDETHRSLVRLNPDGSLDAGYNPVIQDFDESYPPRIDIGILQPDGKLLISGSFVSVNGVSRPGLARLNTDGTLDTGFVPVAGGSPALQQDGKILVGSSRGPLVRLNNDGSYDPSFQPAIANPAFPLIQSDGKIIASQDLFFGEIFSIVRLNSDGSLDSSYSEQPGFAVALDSEDRALVATPGLPLQRVTTDGSIDSSFQIDGDFDLTVLAVAEQPDHKLVLAGQGLFKEPFGIQRLLPDGQADSTFAVGTGLTSMSPSSIYQATLLPDGKLMVGGSFSHLDSVPRNKIGRLNHDGSVDLSFDAGDLLSDGPGPIVSQPDGKILVGFQSEISRLLPTGAIDLSFNYATQGDSGVTAMAVQRDGKILAAFGDKFIRLNPDGTLDTNFDAGLDSGAGVTQMLLQPDGKILINGNFSSVHGTPQHGPVRLNPNGSLDESFSFNGGFVNSLVGLQADGKILMGFYLGIGWSVGRVNSDGSSDESFAGFPDLPACVALGGDGIYVGSNTVVRRQSDGTLNPIFAPVFPSDAAITQLLLQVDGQLVAAGTFTEINGTAVNGIVRLNGVAPEKAGNISTRAVVGTGDAVEIGGFIITGLADKSVVIRGIGPSLQVDGSPLPGTLTDPRLELHGPAGELIAQNEDWRDSQEAEMIASGLAPLDDRESALTATLSPGAYTAIVQGAGGETGIALVEIYDASPSCDSRLQNISTRGAVQSGDNVMIAGLILTGPEEAPVVARALGPSLAEFGVADPLSDPTIELHDQSGAIVAANDNWKDTQQSELAASGLAPTNDKEAAILASLPPGEYTAIVRGANDATGLALVEFYDLR